MDSPERSRSYGKRDTDSNSDVKSDSGGDDEGWEGSDKRKHGSSKPRRPRSAEEGEGLDGSGRRSSGEKNESRKRSGGTSRAGSDEDVYDTKRELSKQTKKSKEESSLEKLSSWYQDGELENKQDGRDKSGNRGHSGAGETERRKASSKFSDRDSSQSRSRSKEERSRDGEREKTADRDSSSLDRRESSRQKGHGSSEQERNPKKRWDESDVGKKAEESSYERTETKITKSSDSKRDNARERSLSARIESNEGKSRG